MNIEQGHGKQYLIVGADEMPEKVASIINQMEVCANDRWSEGSAAMIIS
jgi:hypothetical protein